MGNRTVTADVACGKCGAVHIVTYTYADFGPANSEHEIESCKKCGARLVRERCLSIHAEPK